MWLELAPRRKSEACPPAPPLCTASAPSAWASVASARASISSRVSTTTRAGSCETGVGWRVAVTTISSSSALAGEQMSETAANAAAGSVRRMRDFRSRGASPRGALMSDKRGKGARPRRSKRRSPVRSADPGRANERHAPAGLLARGLSRIRRLPTLMAVAYGGALAAYSCGHSHGLGPKGPSPRSLFTSLRDDRRGTHRSAINFPCNAALRRAKQGCANPARFVITARA